MNTGSWSSEKQIQTFRVFDENGRQLTEYVLGTDAKVANKDILRRVAGIIEEYDIKTVTTNFPPIRMLFKTVLSILAKEYNITDISLDLPEYKEEHDDEVIENDVV